MREREREQTREREREREREIESATFLFRCIFRGCVFGADLAVCSVAFL